MLLQKFQANSYFDESVHKTKLVGTELIRENFDSHKILSILQL